MYKILIDFETRSICDLKKHGAWIYSRHPSTEILCMGYIIARDNEIYKTGIVDCFTINSFLEFFNKHSNKIQVIAHNAFFERCIYYNILVEKFNWPPLRLDQWKCTMAKSSAHALPRALDSLSTELNLEHKKDAKGHRLMLKMSKPRKATKKDDSLWHENVEDLKHLKDYCLADVKAEFDLDNTLRDLSPFEQEIWELDQKINFRGIYIDLDLVEKSLELIDSYLIPIDEQINKITNGFVTTIKQNIKLMNWCNSYLPINKHLKDLSKTTLPKYLIDNDSVLPENVKKVLTLRLQAAKTSTAKFSSIQCFTDDDNRIRGSLLYHGAATGRWAGSGIQPQNLPKGITGLDTDIIIEKIKTNQDLTKDGDPLALLSSCIRGCIRAAPGKILYCGDYASIEARILFFEAQEENALNIFRNNEDIYCDQASTTYNRSITKKDKDERFLGKQAILGLGYGMGIPKFKATCASYGVEISDELAKKVVDSYRNKYLKVKKLWRDIEDAAKNAIFTGRPCDVNNIRYKKVGKFLYCRLPSGRLLSYFKPRIVSNQFGGDSLQYKGVNSLTKKFEYLNTYGGKLVENICQAISRDMMAQAMLNLENSGYPVILTVHDEILCEVDQNSDKTLKEFLEILATPPIWAIDCPLAVEGWEGERYHK